MYDKFSISRAFDGQIVLSVKMTFSLYTEKSKKFSASQILREIISTTLT